jgi:glyoxylase-like metal-dependent hydrolase (beta-lactamase superfamily II)
MNQQAVSPTLDSFQKLLDSVYVMEQSFDGVTVRGALVLGAHRALIFDTLIYPQEINKFLPLCSDRELIVVYSHADWDHIWGTCGLSPSYVLAHEECSKRFRNLEDVEKTLIDYRVKHDEELAQIKLVPPQRTFESNMTLDLGGITVELRHCPGHTKDSILAIAPERALLLGGDCIEAPLPLLNEGSDNLLRWIGVLSEMELDARITTCVPSHGEIGGREILTNNIRYLKSLLLTDSASPPGLDDFYSAGHKANRSKAASLRNS